jgi:Mrp family chromosome partitioning ATPase
MDRIRKALDLARAERERRADGGAVATAEEGALALHVEAADRQVAHEKRLAAALGAAVAAADVHRLEPDDARPVPLARAFEPNPATLARNRILSQHSTSPAAEAFRLLRTQVVQRLDERDWRVLAVVSPGPDEARVRVACNLAAAIAADTRYHALLVDLDLREPSVAELFGLRPEHGVEDVLGGCVPVESCLHRPTGYERLVLLPARAPIARGSELLASPAARRLLGELRDRYPDRLIVCNLAPVLATDEALAFAPLVDCALMVVTEARTRRADLARAMTLLQRTPVLGSVLGDASAAGRSTE